MYRVPIGKASLVRSTSIALGACAILLLMVIAAIIYLVYETQAHIDAAARARLVRSTSADLLLAIQDGETGQRGYLLTRQDSFLKPYIASIGALQEREAAFEKAVLASDYLHIDPKLIRDTINKKVGELQRTIALAQAERYDEAMAVVRDESGLQLMSNIRATLTDVIEISDKRVADQFASNLHLAMALRIVVIIGTVAVIAIMFAVVMVIRGYVREILAARTALEGLNTGLEERVRERTEDLVQANQEVQRFAYIVTHDLRSPLVNIMGFTSELEGGLKTINAYFKDEGGMTRDDVRQNAMRAVDEDLPEALQFIRSSIRKMDDLINAVLKISRDGRRQLKPEPIDLQALIKTASEVIHHRVLDANGDVTIKVNVKRFNSDKFSLEQIFGNLLDNAVKYRDPARPLKLSISAYELNRHSIGIDVADNGRGIAPEDHERVFELFRRSGTQNSQGEGIGLAHVRSLIRNMGGDIQVKSELGKGTVFMIRLPTDLSRYVGSQG